MIVDNVKTGDRIKITYEGSTLSSTVEVVLDPQTVVICAPMLGTRIIKLEQDIVYSMICIHNGQMYRFDMEILDYNAAGKFNFLTIRLLTLGEKLQKRSFFRLACEVPADFVLIDAEGQQESEEDLPGTVKDISGGGMCLVASANMANKQVIRCFMFLHEEFLMVFGYVIRKEIISFSPVTFRYQVKFTAITSAEQDQIVRYVYNEQRRSIKNNQHKKADA